MVVDGEQILLGLRAPQIAMGDHWNLFGGKVDPHEDEIEALKRELLEEAAISIEPGELLDVILYDDCRGQGLWRCPIYLVTCWTGQVAINEEHAAYGWHGIAELKFLQLAHEKIYQLADQALMLVARAGNRHG